MIKKTLKTNVAAVKQAVVDVANKLQNKTPLDIELDKLRGEYKKLKHDIATTVDSMEIDHKTEQLKKDFEVQMRNARGNFAGFKNANEATATKLVSGITVIISDIRKKLSSLK